MIAPAGVTLRDALQQYLSVHLLKPSTAELYAVAVSLYERWAGRPVLLSDVSDASVIDWMRWLSKSRCSQTVNSRRRALLTILRFAGRSPAVPRVREVRRHPTAWSTEDLSRLLSECSRARLWCNRHRSVWLPAHWRALVLVIYDTSMRIGALLTVPRSAVDLQRQTLLIPGEHQKHRADTLHRLHPQTCAEIARLPKHRLLFPWPMRREQLWVWFGRILKRAGLPATRRDKFHRIRRTAYTQTYKALGPLAAQKHAGHATDLSRYYLDPSFLDDVAPVDVIPRP